MSYFVDYTQMLRRNHLCRRCKQQDAFTLNGRMYCSECADKFAQRRRNEYRDPKRRKVVRETQKNIYDKRKEQGLCTRCGRINKDTKHATCSICRAQRRADYSNSFNNKLKRWNI